jgi:endonuclease III
MAARKTTKKSPKAAPKASSRKSTSRGGKAGAKTSKTRAKTTTTKAKSTAKAGKAKGKAAPKKTAAKKPAAKKPSGKKAPAKKAPTKKAPAKKPAAKAKPATTRKTAAKAAPKAAPKTSRPAPSTSRKTAPAKTERKPAPKPKRKAVKPTKAMLASILEKCDKALGAVVLPECSSILERAVYLVLREQGTENTTSKAMAALREEFVDWNEVRVSRPSELSRLMSGSSKGAAVRRYHERAERMKEMIDQIYNDRNETSLEFLLEERSKGRFEYLEDVDDLGLHNALALVQWLSGEDKLQLVSKELAEAAYALGLIDSVSVTKARTELAALSTSKEQLVSVQAHLNHLGGMEETKDWPPMMRELLV